VLFTSSQPCEQFTEALTNCTPVLLLSDITWLGGVAPVVYVSDTGFRLAVMLPPLPVPTVRFTGMLNAAPTDGVTITEPWQKPVGRPAALALTESCVPPEPELMVFVPAIEAVSQFVPKQVVWDVVTVNVIWLALLVVIIGLEKTWNPGATFKLMGLTLDVSAPVPPVLPLVKLIVMKASGALPSVEWRMTLAEWAPAGRKPPKLRSNVSETGVSRFVPGAGVTRRAVSGRTAAAGLPRHGAQHPQAVQALLQFGVQQPRPDQQADQRR